jgi:hypothetical protein
MTEAEWLGCREPEAMLEFLCGKGRDRKLRLFACACCRRVWERLGNRRSQSAVVAAEKFADCAISQDELSAAATGASIATGGTREAGKPLLREVAALAASPWQDRLEEDLLRAAQLVRAKSRATEAGASIQAGLIRCIFGNPFCPSTVDPSCRTPVVAALAQAAYGERQFPSGQLDPARIAVLADALEDAGCDAAAILDHLRSPGPHVRGCWALDLVLGKA